jgi:hypothetical protein
VVSRETAFAVRAISRAVDVYPTQDKAEGDRPKTPDELHGWVREITGHDIPRVAVCPDHQAPFDFIADLYFHVVSEALVMANRGGGKTQDVAALHLANAAFKPSHETSHIGAIELQGKRCYGYYKKGLRHPTLAKQAPNPHIRDTEWLNGSRIEILPGTEAQTQGGHPMLVAYDELESGKWQPYENSKLMPNEWQDGDVGRVGQFVATSTRVTSLGLMQRALDEAEENDTPVYEWCIYETMRPCTEDCEANGCQLYEWTEGRSRNAVGWRSHADILATYNRVGEDTWEAQMLCRKPEAKALIYANFTKANITDGAVFIPGAGPMLVDYDWGFTDPTYIGLLQYRDGAWYQFDELTGSGRSEREWVREIVKRILALPDYDGPGLAGWEKIWAGREPWPSPWPDVWPSAAAGDPSAVQMRAELKEHGFGTRSPENVKHKVESGQDVLRAAICAAGGLRRLFIHPKCTEGIRGLSNYRARVLADGSYDPRPDPDPANHAFSHGPDAHRYLMWTQRKLLGLTMEGGEDGRE